MTNTMQDAQGQAPRSASTTAPTLAERANDVGSTVSEEARSVAHDVKDHARQVAHETRESLRSEASNQAARLASTLRDIGGQLRSMADTQTGGGMVVDLSQQLARSATRAADKLDDGGLDATLLDLKHLARRRPGLFLIGAMGAGFAAGRLLKAVDTHALVEAGQQPTQDPRVLAERPLDLREATL